MLDTAMKMPEMIAAMSARLYRTIENQPEYLLESDGGPEGIDGHVLIARLIGRDDQIDHEWRIDSARHELLTPRFDRRHLRMAEEPALPTMPQVNRYRLQSNYGTLAISLEMLDAETVRWIGQPPDPTTFQWRIVALRYRVAD